MCALITATGLDTPPERALHKFNTVTKSQVLARVLLLHALSTLGTFLDLWLVRDFHAGPVRWWCVGLGCVLMDVAQYVVHRIQHLPSVYKYAHKSHHALVYPYSYSAMYNSLAEAALSVPFILASLAPFSWMEGALVQTIAYVATVVQHCNPNSLHHLHHNGHPDKNFQQPFSFWIDYLCGTLYVPEGMPRRAGLHI